MKKIIVFLILCMGCFAAFSQEFSRQQCLALIQKADNAKMYSEKQEILKEMQDLYSLYGNFAIHEKRGSVSLYYSWMNAYAHLNRHFGSYAEAENAFNELISHSIGNNSVCKMARQNRLNIWLRQGKYTEIINMITQQSSLLPSDSDSRIQAQFILAEAYYNRNLGNGFGNDDSYKAYQILEQIALENESDHNENYLKALNNLGLMYAGFGDKYLLSAYRFLKEGLQFYEKSELLNLSDDNKRKYYTLLSNFAYIQGKMGDYVNAIAHIDEVLRWQKLKLPFNDNHYITSLWKKAQILYWRAQDEGDVKMEEAVKAFKTYYKLQREYILRNFAFMTEHERNSFWAAQYEPLSSCYLVGMADPQFAYEVALFIKNIQTQTTFDLRKVAQQINNTRLNSLADAYEENRNDMNKMTVIEKRANRLLVSNKLYKSFMLSLKMTPNDIVKNMRETDIAIEWIETEVGGDSTYVALILDAKGHIGFQPVIKKHQLFDREVSGGQINIELKNAIVSKNSSVKDYIYNNRSLGTDLWSYIMKEVPSGANIYFAPTGILHLLAVEYLQFDRKNCRFFRLSSTGELCERTSGSNHDWSIMLVGGIDYNEFEITDQEVENPNRLGYTELGRKHVFGRNMIFSELPGAAREVDSLMHTFNHKGALVKGKWATERYVKDNLPKFDIVHLSTHGYSLDFGNEKLLQRDSLMQDQLLLRSGLALAGANVAGMKNTKVEDGILTAKEISELDLSQVKLVSLSACQTAIGRITEEEVSSISRGFKKAGVGAMIVSLWSTGDDASQVFFCKFYEYLQADKNHSVRKAFDDARSFMMNAGKVTILYGSKGLSPKTLTGRKERTLVKTVDLSQSKYYDSYILIDAIK